MRERREQELPERTGGGTGAKGETAPAFRHQLAERADHHRERTAGEAEPDQHAGRQIEHQRCRRIAPSRRGRARREWRRAHSTRIGPKRSATPPANGCTAPHSRFCSASANEKHVAAPAVIERQRRQELAERRAWPERKHRDRAADRDQHCRRAPVSNSRHGGRDGHWLLRLAGRRGRRMTAATYIVARPGSPKRKFVMATICQMHGSVSAGAGAPRTGPLSNLPGMRIMGRC